MSNIKALAYRPSSEQIGLRLDVCLLQGIPGGTRSQWTERIRSGRVLVNEQAAKPSYLVKLHDQILVLSAELEAKPVQAFRGPIPEIVYQDQDCVVVSKPIGLAVHPGAGKDLEDTLLGYLMEHNWIDRDDQWNASVLEERRPGIVHRLDADTSGLMVVARHRHAHAQLAKQFETRVAGRRYQAVIHGHLSQLLKSRPRALDILLAKNSDCVALRMNAQGQGSFAAYLQRDPAHRTRFRIGAEGRYSLSEFESSEVSPAGFSWVWVKLHTGRTHQIRVHLKALGFPIVGDRIYGGLASTRLWLHAFELKFQHPVTLRPMTFQQMLSSADQAHCRQEFGLLS